MLQAVRVRGRRFNSRHLSGLSKLSIDRETFSGSVDVGFVLALSFHHGDLEPDCVYRSFDEGGLGGGGLMRGIKILPQDFPLKIQGGGGRICGTLRYLH